MDEYIFVLAKSEEIPEIVDIYNGLVGTPGCTWSFDYPNKETAEYDIKKDSLYVLKKNKKIIAVATVGSFNELNDLEWKPKNPCELHRIGVISTMLNQGIGTILLQNTIKTVKELKYDGMRFLVSKKNISALALYDKIGFERCGEVFMHDIDFYCYQIVF